MKAHHSYRMDHGTCSECGAQLTFGERKLCQACWNAYWNAQLEAVPVERLVTEEQAHLEEIGNELVLIVANLKQRLVLAETIIEQREQSIRFMQERIDNLDEDLRITAEYLAAASQQLEREQARADGLLYQNNKLAAELMDAQKRNGHRLLSR